MVKKNLINIKINYYIYLFYDKNIEYLLNIKANKNTVYSVLVNYNIPSNEKMIFIPIGINYLFKFDNNLNDYIFNISNYENKYDSIDIETSYFFGFYPLNCKIEVKDIKTNINLKEKNGFYQDIIIYDEEKNDFIYNVTKIDKKQNDCMFVISSFIFEDWQNTDYFNGISLSINESKSFIFDKDNKKLKFLYSHSEKEKDLKINFKLLDDEKYDIIIFFNDLSYENKNSILNNDSIIIKSQDLQYYCMNYNQVCKINFLVESKNQITESILEILITNNSNEPESKDSQNSNSGNNILLYSLFSIILIISLILIILVIILIFKLKNKKKLSNEDIDKLTYLNDKRSSNSN